MKIWSAVTAFQSPAVKLDTTLALPWNQMNEKWKNCSSKIVKRLLQPFAFLAMVTKMHEQTSHNTMKHLVLSLLRDALDEFSKVRWSLNENNNIFKREVFFYFEVLCRWSIDIDVRRVVNSNSNLHIFRGLRSRKTPTLEHFNRSRHFPEEPKNRRADCSSNLFAVQNPLQLIAKKIQAVRSNCVEIETTVWSISVLETYQNRTCKDDSAA